MKKTAGSHLFVKCKKVKPVWRSLLLEDVRLKLLSAPTATAMFDMIWTLPGHSLAYYGLLAGRSTGFCL
jgi:hypothetical protein